MRFMTEMIEVAKKPPEQWTTEFATLNQQLPNLPALARLLIPAMDKVAQAVQRSYAYQRCAIVMLAAERFRKRYDRWPESLDELKTTGLLAEIPTDPYIGGPLKRSNYLFRGSQSGRRWRCPRPNFEQAGKRLRLPALGRSQAPAARAAAEKTRRQSMTEREFATEIVRKLRDAGHQALFAGGCVRDQLLGLEPHDFDVATDARPDEVQALFRRTIAVGASFGVIEVLGPKPLKVQVATFRSDDAYVDGRRPVTVHFSSPEEDARRRDFTINGLLFDPIADHVIDFVAGERDLRDGVVRAIGDPRQRFAEDKLRLMRAVRFAARFQFQIEPATAAAIREMADQITVVSAERIAEELRKILTNEQRAKGLKLLEDSLLGRPIFPELFLPPDRWRSGVDVVAELAEPVSFALALAALLHTLTPDDTERVAERLRLSNVEKDRLVWLIDYQSALIDAPTLRKSVLKPILAHAGVRELLALHRARAQADERRGTSIDYAEFCDECLRDWPPEALDPAPLITGDDLRALGLTPGPHFKGLLDAVRRAQLDEEIATREQALGLVRSLV
jgi:poly(A) polymerase